MRLALLETGGTINGILDPAAAPPDRSRVLDWLRQHGGLAVRADILCMKDSRAVLDTDRARLAEAIEHSEEDRILIPHGTYSMPETGVYLRRALSQASLEKRIILVGALVPLEEPESDAPATLVFALEQLDLVSPGVWIAMSGRLWDPARVIKDPVTGQYRARS